MMSATAHPQTLHQWALQAGFTETIPIIPANATLHPNSRVDPRARGKVPGQFYGGAWDGFTGWPEYRMDAGLAAQLDQLGANVGLKMGFHYVALDVDIKDDLCMQAVRAALAEAGVTAPVRVGQAPKALWLFRVAGEPINRRQYPIHQTDEHGNNVIGPDGKPVSFVVDVMGVSRKGRPTQAVILGTHPTGAVYQWDKPPIAADLPVIDQDGIDKLVQVVLAVTDSRGWKRGRPSAAGGSGLGRTSNLSKPNDPRLIVEVMNAMGNDYEWDDWIRIGLCLCSVVGHDEGWPLWDAWSQRSPKYEPDKTEQVWDSFEPEGTMTFGTLVQYARDQNALSLTLDSRIAADSKYRAVLQSGVMPAVAEPYVPYDPSVPIPEGLPSDASIGTSEPASTLPTANVSDLPELDDPDAQYVTRSDGTIISTYKNYLIYLAHDPRWKPCFAYDAFADRAVVLSPLPSDPNQSDREMPRPLSDYDYLTARGWFQSNGHTKAAKGDVIDAVDAVCVRNTFEPVQFYLNSLPPVMPGLLDDWLFRFVGVARTGDPGRDRYVSQIGRKWLIGAVARAMRPGCQMDNALVFEGPQGIGKSSAFRALCPDEEWFGDSLPDFHSKDAAEYLNGKWIVELAELASMRKSELEDFRAFLTRRIEDYIPKYVRRTVYRPRRCVFAGSTNRDSYLQDAAGERRIWPVHVGRVDVDGLKAARDALWREALDAYNTGEGWYLDAETEAYATQLQRERVEVDPWQDVIETQIAHLSEVTPMLIYRMIGKTPDQWDQRVSRRIANILTAMGFVRAGKISHGEFKGKARYVRK